MSPNAALATALTCPRLSAALVKQHQHMRRKEALPRLHYRHHPTIADAMILCTFRREHQFCSQRGTRSWEEFTRFFETLRAETLAPSTLHISSPQQPPFAADKERSAFMTQVYIHYRVQKQPPLVNEVHRAWKVSMLAGSEWRFSCCLYVVMKVTSPQALDLFCN